MRLQSGQNFCGLATAANGLRAIGRRVSEDQVAAKVKLLADDAEPHVITGTTEIQILKAMRAYRIGCTQVQVHQAEAGMSMLRGYLYAGRPVFLAVDNDSHWVVAVGQLGGLIHVADSAHEEIVVPYKEDALLSRWGYAGDPQRFYGLAMNVRR